MNVTKEKQVLNLQVTEGLTVAVLPNSDHEFLMPTKEVASGYGVSESTLRSHAAFNKDELLEGKHFVKAVEIFDTLPKRLQPHQTYWTKRGIVRLGFFIKSDRAKMFRDWAEDLVINSADHFVETNKMIAEKRNHNRLTPERVISILQDVCRIEDKELRESLLNKVTGGQ